MHSRGTVKLAVFQPLTAEVGLPKNSMIKSVHIIKILFLTICISTLSACSWLTNLAINNSTEHPIIVTYKLKPYGMQPGYILKIPRIVPLNSFDQLPSNYPEAQYELDKATGIISLEVPAGKTVWLDTISNYKSSYYERGAKYLNLLSLTVKSDSGTKKWEGVELMKAFKKYSLNPFNDSLYVLTI